MKQKAPAAPPRPLPLARSQTDLHFRAPGNRTDQVAQFKAAKTLSASDFLAPLRASTTASHLISAVTLTSSGLKAAEQLFKGKGIETSARAR